MEASQSYSKSSPLLLPHGHDEDEDDGVTNHPIPKKLTLIHLLFLVYFDLGGGPYGNESAVGAASPFLAILGFLIFPFLWSIPEALVTAELATTFPDNGGFVVWASLAFGPFWGSLMGSWKFLSGVVNLASYPVLCVDYLKLAIPPLSSGTPRYLAVVLSTLMLSFLNYTGVTVVGHTAVTLGILSLIPFFLMTLIAIPKVDPLRWLSLGEKKKKKNWVLFFNTLFWNLNSCDNASALAGEVENPQKAFPKALLSAGILTCLAYLIPLLATIGAIPLDHQEDWVDGYFADAAEIIGGGKWLKIWVEMGALLSTVGLFEAQLSTCAYQFLGMVELGLVPQSFGARSKWFNTPWVGILLSTTMALTISYKDFADIVSSANFLYSLGMLLEFASFLRLRQKMARIQRPFRVPLEMPGLVIMCLIPCCFLVYVITVASEMVYLLSFLWTILALAWYLLIKFCRSKKWIDLNSSKHQQHHGVG
ncbi:hypothetical protein Dimus_011643 [Dionaea muscipula]